MTNQYTFWSGTIAALFLFCSYFGTDQSQVQRYLTAGSLTKAQRAQNQFGSSTDVPLGFPVPPFSIFT